MKRYRRAVHPLALWVALSSCALPVPHGAQELQYHLWAPELGARVEKRTGQATLLLSTPRADAGFDTPRMVYLIQPYTLSYYATHQWVDTPPRLLMPLLAEAMERTGRFRTVLQMPTSLPGDYRLDVDIARVQQEFLQRPSQVRLSLRAQWVDLRTLRVLGHRTFEVTEPAPSDDPYGGAIATNRALARLLSELAAWASALLPRVRAG